MARAIAEQAGRAGGVDVSHRGGKPGFVRVEADGTLTVPDFVGNYFFNTLGNLVVNPRAGLLFVDFDTGDLLYLAVTAEIIWDGPEVDSFAGAQRLMRFKVQSMRLVESSLPLRWGEAELSPALEATGAWV
jgi:predicted pyridoxine 5'-phosphate oxidase superfamily flavin-nucleotide-binding protein